MKNRTERVSTCYPLAFAMALAAIACALVLGWARVPAYADEGLPEQDQPGSSGQLVAGSADELLQAQANGSQLRLGAIVKAKDDPSAARFVKALQLAGDSASTVALPSFTDLTALELYYVNDDNKGSLAFVSASPEGPYSQGAVNVASLPRDVVGGYCAYVKSSASASPELVRIVWSANVRTVFLSSDDPVNKGRAYIEASP